MLKLQYFGYLMWRVNSLEKTLMLGKTEGGRRGDWGWYGSMASPTKWTRVWANSRRQWWQKWRTAWHAAVHVVTKSQTWLSNWTKTAQFSSVTQSCPTFYDPMDCITPGFSVHHQHSEFTQTHVHWVGDAIQPFDPLLSPSPSAFNLSQHKCLFQWVSSSHQVAKVLELQLQHQSFQWIFKVDFP